MGIFLVTFRETLEAAIIIGVIFSLLRVFQTPKNTTIYIIGGIVLWVIMSFFFAAGFEYFFGNFQGRQEEIFEWILMLVASAMITQFLIWTNNHFKHIWVKIKNSLEYIITSWQIWMLSLLVFVSVLREWVETVIFLRALDFRFTNSDIWLALSGIFAAIGVSYAISFGLKKMNFAKILRITNILFVLLAGGLLAHGIVELQSAGVLPTFVKPLFDLSDVLSEKEWLWAILKSALSYDANPSLLAFAAYMLYITGMWTYFYMKKRI